MISIWYYVAVGILIVLSAFFSATEIAYSAANRLRLENAMETGNGKARAAYNVLDKFDDALSTLLIGNNLVNMAASSITTVIAITLAGGSERYTSAATALITILLIIFGETVPKIVAKKNANRFAMTVAYFVRVLMTVMKPVVALVVFLTGVITKPLKGESGPDGQDAVDELVSIIETVEDEGVIDEERSELLQAALDFPEVSASEAMTARVDVQGIDIEDSWDEILETIDSSSYSRLPVYEGSIDNIIGILSLNHFYKARTDNAYVDIRSLLIDPCYVYKTQKLPGVLAEMRKKKIHMAIITDEYGGTMGLVTMEDVLEQIVGEIWDETDAVKPEFIKHSESEYEIDGDMTIGDFLELLDRDEGEFDTESATIGGWTLEMFGKYPSEGESFEAHGLVLTVLEMDGMRVANILVRTANMVKPSDIAE